MRPPAQVLIDLMDKLTALLTATVIPANKDEHDAEVARVREEIAQAKEALAAEDTRLATERAALDARAQRLQSEAYQLTMSLNASNEVMRRRHQKTQSRLPSNYDPRVLFATPGAGPSNPPEANQLMTAGTGGPAQPREMAPPHGSMAPPRYVPIPPGHFSNPMENLIAASARLAALPVDGDDPTAVETRRIRELVQTALAQQETYSYSRDRIHSTPRPSRS